MSSKARKPYLKTDHFKGGGSIHELAANAVKYGALSAPDGSVAVDWTLDGDIAAPDLRPTCA